MSHPPISPGRLATITVFVVLASAMQAMDSTIANVALPHMQGTMGATQDQIAWVLTSYMVASAIGLMLTTTLVERFGRTRIYVLGIVAFTLASMCCGMAQSLPEIVLARALQGFLGGTLIPLSQAIMIDLYPAERRTLGMSMWSMGALMGPILGPTLGGILTDAYNWRWVFFINLPIGILSAAGLALTLPETSRQRGGYFDALGFGLLTIAVSAFQIMLDRGETQDWFSLPEINIEAIIAATGFYLFFVHTLTSEQPFISRILFRDKNFVVATVLSGFLMTTAFSMAALVPTMLQTLMNYTAAGSGMVMSSRALGAVVSLSLLSRLVRYGARLVVFVGSLVAAVALWMMSKFTLDMDALHVEIAGALMGFGSGVAMTQLAIMTFTTLSPKFTTEASAVGSLIRNMFASAGISITIAILSNNNQINHQVLTEHVTAFSRPVQDLAAHSMVTLNTLSGLAVLNGTINREAAMTAYVDDFVILAWIACLVAPFVFLLRIGPRPASPPQAVPQEV